MSKGAKQHKFSVQTKDGPVEVLGWYVPEQTPEGLYACNSEKVFGEELLKKYGSIPSWVVLHHSGFSVAVGFEKRGQALEAAEWLGDLTDWSKPPVQVAEVENIVGKVQEVLAEFGEGVAA